MSFYDNISNQYLVHYWVKKIEYVENGGPQEDTPSLRFYFTQPDGQESYSDIALAVFTTYTYSDNDGVISIKHIGGK